MGNISLADRRNAVLSVMDDAARSANVPRELIGGIWGKESSFGKHLTSPTGCQGDFQFTQGTWANMIRNYGTQIAARLRATGHEDLAATVEKYQDDLKHRRIRNGNDDLQALRDNPYISTYAAAYLMAETARSVRADPWKREDWRHIYAGYNIGPKDARDLRGRFADTENCKQYLGNEARVNPAFFVNRATGTQALQRYQNAMETFARDFNARFGNGASPAPAKAPVTEPSPAKTPAPPQQPGAKADYFSEIVGRYLGDGKVHTYRGTIVKYGICQSANPGVDVANLTREQALEVYRNKYWNGIKGIEKMSKEEAAAAFDVSYRHGPDYANRVLQRINGSAPAPAEKKAEPLKTSFARSTDPTQEPAVASAPPAQENSLTGSFLRSAAHYVLGFLRPVVPGLPAPGFF